MGPDDYKFSFFLKKLDSLDGSMLVKLNPAIAIIPPPWIDRFKFISTDHLSIVIFDNETKVIVNDMHDNQKSKIPVSKYTGFLYAMLKWQAYYGDCKLNKKDYTKICDIQIRRNDLLEGILIGVIGFDNFNAFKDRIMEQFYSEEK